MSKVILDMSVSLDGFVAASGATHDEPMGQGGERLHDWAMPGGDRRSHELLTENAATLGALVTGRRTYEQSVRWWGDDGPAGEARLPVYVVTHRATRAHGVYTFVTDGIDRAVAEAKEAAGDRNVGLSGVDVAGQLIRAGLVDELWIHVVPVLFGEGVRFYEHVGGPHVGLRHTEVVDTPSAIHVRLAVDRA